MRIYKMFVNAFITAFVVYMLNKYIISMTYGERVFSVIAMTYVLQEITGVWR